MNRSLYLAGLSLLVSSAICYGQTAIAIAKVPFDFHLGSTSMPGGKYVVREISPGVLSFQNAAGETVLSPSLPAERRPKSTAPSLVFQRYGDDYFLANIWFSNSQAGCAFRKSKQEQQLARREQFKRTEQVALRLP